MVDESALLKLVDSKSELKEIVRNEHYLHVILGEDSQQEKMYYVANIREKTNLRKGIQIGIISKGHGLKPRILLDANNKMAYIGNNREVSIINCENATIQKTLQLDSLFYELISIENESKLLLFMNLESNVFHKMEI